MCDFRLHSRNSWSITFSCKWFYASPIFMSVNICIFSIYIRFFFLFSRYFTIRCIFTFAFNWRYLVNIRFFFYPNFVFCLCVYHLSYNSVHPFPFFLWPSHFGCFHVCIVVPLLSTTSLSLSIYIYIYIYVCVCVCVYMFVGVFPFSCIIIHDTISTEFTK